MPSSIWVDVREDGPKVYLQDYAVQAHMWFKLLHVI